MSQGPADYPQYPNPQENPYAPPQPATGGFQPPYVDSPYGAFQGDMDDDSGFAPAPGFGPRGPVAPPPMAPGVTPPPAYDGAVTGPDPFAFPLYPDRVPDTTDRVYEAQGDELPPDNRVPYQAPRRRRGTLAYLYAGLVVLVLVLGGIAISQLLNNPAPRTAVVTISRQGTTYAGEAVVVRNESVFMQEDVTSVRYVAAEASAVNRGDLLCTVYTSGFSTKELESLQKYRKDIKEYQRILLSGTDVPDTRLQRLETTVFERAAETQALIRGAKGNLINQEILLREAIAERHKYLKQKFPDDAKLARLYDSESNQLQRIDAWTKQFSATDNGIVSFYTDGFEGALNASSYAAYNPEQVRKMYQGQLPSDFKRPKNSVDIYRLVRQNDWHVLMLASDMSWNPVVGDSYKMLIESFESTTVDATIESVTRAGKDMLVRLKVNSDVDPVLYIRSCRVQLSKSIISYAVPANALVSKDGVIGVVVSFREGNFVVPVNVLSQDATQAHVVPLNPAYLYEGLHVLLPVDGRWQTQ